MGSWVEEWEDGNEPEGWVARRMADAFDRMIRLAQASGEGVEELRRNLSDARRRQAAAADTRTTIAGHPRPASDASASPVALVATRPSHGPPALPA